MDGRWLLIEDIDLASHDILAILIPLLETRTLLIPSRGEKIRASDNFRLFATRTTNHKYPLSHSVLENLWHKIKCIDIPVAEIKDIVDQNYPSTQNVSELMMDFFQHIKRHSQSIKSFQRTLSLHDLLKWFNRVSKLQISSLTPQTREFILREAFDLFYGFISDPELSKEYFLYLGSVLGVPEYRSEFYVSTYVPDLKNESGQCVRIGRALIEQSEIPTNSYFALTFHALHLLERLAVSVNLNERILLIGETGTGKTTTVQYLAKLMNKTLNVFNMSQQSESSDLVGGFKPIDSTTFARSLMDRFSVLFGKTFNATKNALFMQTLHRSFQKKKWKKMCIGFVRACQMAKEVYTNNELPIAFNDLMIPDTNNLDYSVSMKKRKTHHSIV